MSEGRTLEGDERLRLFVALALPGKTVARLVLWQRREVDTPDTARLVPAENLHITLAFLGPTPGEAVPAIVEAMREAVRGIRRPVLRIARYRETQRVGMLVLDDEEGRATLAAARLAERLESLGVYRPEKRPWTAHVTVLRFRPGQQPRLRPELPDLGPVSPSEVALYHSVLRPDGAQYRRRESVALGG